MIRKRQPLKEMDVNSFNDEERKIENEKNFHKNPSILTLASDNDQENLPVTMKKRSMMSTNTKPHNRKQM